MNVKQFGFILVMASLTGCSSSSHNTSASSNVAIPDWLVNPVVDGGFAATDCVEYSGNIFNDQKLAVAKAQQALEERVTAQLAEVDKAYLAATGGGKTSLPNTTFSAVPQERIKPHFSASRVMKADIIAIAGKDYFCALTQLPPEQSKSLFQAVIKNSEIALASNEERRLFQVFKTYQVEQDVDKEIIRLTK